MRRDRHAQREVGQIGLRAREAIDREVLVAVGYLDRERLLVHPQVVVLVVRELSEQRLGLARQPGPEARDEVVAEPVEKHPPPLDVASLRAELVHAAGRLLRLPELSRQLGQASLGVLGPVARLAFRLAGLIEGDLGGGELVPEAEVRGPVERETPGLLGQAGQLALERPDLFRGRLVIESDLLEMTTLHLHLGEPLLEGLRALDLAPQRAEVGRLPVERSGERMDVRSEPRDLVLQLLPTHAGLPSLLPGLGSGAMLLLRRRERRVGDPCSLLPGGSQLLRLGYLRLAVAEGAGGVLAARPPAGGGGLGRVCSRAPSAPAGGGRGARPGGGAPGPRRSAACEAWRLASAASAS